MNQLNLSPEAHEAALVVLMGDRGPKAYALVYAALVAAETRGRMAGWEQGFSAGVAEGHADMAPMDMEPSAEAVAAAERSLYGTGEDLVGSSVTVRQDSVWGELRGRVGVVKAFSECVYTVEFDGLTDWHDGGLEDDAENRAYLVRKDFDVVED